MPKALKNISFVMPVLNEAAGIVATLAALYGSQFRLDSLGVPDCLAFLFFSGMLGWLGSYLSVSVHLQKVD